MELSDQERKTLEERERLTSLVSDVVEDSPETERTMTRVFIERANSGGDN